MGGGGGYTAELARALPDSHVTLADLPEIIPIAKEYLDRKGLRDRVEVVAADFLSDGCGLGDKTVGRTSGGTFGRTDARTFAKAYDCVFLSHVLHDFDAPAASAIVARAARLVRAPGKLVILDVLVPDGGQSNPVEALFDLMMLIEVPGGRTHRISDVREWIKSAGMDSPTPHKLHFGILLESRAK